MEMIVLIAKALDRQLDLYVEERGLNLDLNNSEDHEEGFLDFCHYCNSWN